MISDREAWLAATMIELACAPADGVDETEYASTFARRLAELLVPAEIMVLLRADPGYPAVTTGSSERAAGLGRLEAGGTGPAADCCRTGRAVRQEPLTKPAAQSSLFAAAARAAGFESVAALPMCHQDETIGAVAVLSPDDHPLDVVRLGLATLLAEAAAIGVSQQRALVRSLRTARELQGALDSRVIIEQAKGAAAAWLDITPDTAFGLLRGYSRRSGRLLSEVAGDVVRGAIPARDLAGSGKPAGRGAAGGRLRR